MKSWVLPVPQAKSSPLPVRSPSKNWISRQAFLTPRVSRTSANAGIFEIGVQGVWLSVGTALIFGVLPSHVANEADFVSKHVPNRQISNQCKTFFLSDIVQIALLVAPFPEFRGYEVIRQRWPMKKISVLITHKISVIAPAITTDPRIALGSGKMAKCLERGSPVKIGVVRILPDKIRLVRDGHSFAAAEDTIVFHNHDSWSDRRDGFPDPVVVAINIDAQNSDALAKTGILNDGIDIFAGNETGQGSEIMSPIDLLVSDSRDVMLTSIHHKTAPIIVE